MTDGCYIKGAQYSLPPINLSKTKQEDPSHMKFTSSVVANCLAGILTTVFLFVVSHGIRTVYPPHTKIVCDLSKDGQHHWDVWQSIGCHYNADGSIGQYRYCEDCHIIRTRVQYPEGAKK